MTRRVDYNGQTKTIAATSVQTLVWTASDIPGDRVIGYHVVFEGAGNTLADVDRIRLSANGSNIINITPAQLIAFWQAFNPMVKLPTTATSFTIPLYLPDAPQPDLQDISQFPANSQVQLEIVTLNTTAAGSAYVGWTETDVDPVFFPRLLASAMNIPASVALQRFNIQENGIMRGIFLDQTGIDRAKVALGNEEFILAPGEEFQGFAAVGNMLFESETLYGNGPSSAGTPLTTAAFQRLTAGIPAPVDGSFVELQTGAGWGGVANEVVTYAIAPNTTEAAQPA